MQLHSISCKSWKNIFCQDAISTAVPYPKSINITHIVISWKPS